MYRFMTHFDTSNCKVDSWKVERKLCYELVQQILGTSHFADCLCKGGFKRKHNFF